MLLKKFTCVLLTLAVLLGDYSEAANLGEDCTSTDVCAQNVTDSECNSAGKCACKSTHFPEGDTICTLKKILDYSCADDEQCGVADSECSNSVCKCKVTHYPIGRTNCTLKVDIGGVCKESIECKTAESECTDGFCSCAITHYPVGTPYECVERKELDVACETKIECNGIYGDCVNRRCSCDKDHYRTGSNCTEKSEINGACVTVEHCKGSQIRCSTSTNKCTCTIEGVPDAENKVCLEKNYRLDGDCEVPLQCQAQNSECRTVQEDDEDGAKYCLCKAGYIRFSDTQCLKPEILGGDCEQHVQCTTNVVNSECHDSNKTCACKNEQVSSESKQKCLEKKKLAQICEDSNQCLANVDNSICASVSETRKECTCLDKFNAVDGQCTNGAPRRNHVQFGCLILGIVVTLNFYFN